MSEPRVFIRDRYPAVVSGYTHVVATVLNGDSGEYVIANALVGTDGEIREILAQSEDRMVARRATAPGHE